jgi:hypothetical protein
MSAYLFVHFKEKRTPDGEQVYFSISTDGFHWEKVNDGNPVLWSYKGDKGVRDFTITRTKDGQFVILATDLSLAYGMPYQYENSWKMVSRNGSKCLVMWKSNDLIHWSEQQMPMLGDEHFGCLWAPDILYDKETDSYLVHWSSAHDCNDFGPKAIFYSRTKDFETFDEPHELYRRPDKGGVIDSAMYAEDGRFYMFLKNEGNPHRIILVAGDHITGPFERVREFDKCMESLEEGKYEAPTAFRLQDGRWCLMLDYYGCTEDQQGYVPFLADSLKSGHFERADEAFAFPYGFKHGTVLKITQEEYERLSRYHKSASER